MGKNRLFLLLSILGVFSLATLLFLVRTSEPVKSLPPPHEKSNYAYWL
ncbi:hypothetical protein [Paenibacillus sp. FSL A5-0031]|nr:hypothetical protein [Paenibacillus sp. FSL A5-0031]